MKFYQTNCFKVTGSNYKEIKRNTFILFKEIKRKTKRKPYIRSAYFNKEKIFFDFFWNHLFQKNPKQRFLRLQYFKASIDLIKNSKIKPDFVKDNKEIFYRFYGVTKNKETFCVQIKRSIKRKSKYFMSCFPYKIKILRR